MRRELPGVELLRDATLDDLEACREMMSAASFKRCRHIITENARVLAAAQALITGDPAAVGRLMAASHASLRDDYEVSTRELDVMVDAALAEEGTIGARMTGGGFGGCTVNLVRRSEAEAFSAGVSARYEAATGRVPDIYRCTASDGAGRVG